MTGHTTRAMQAEVGGDIRVCEFKCPDCGCDMLEEIMAGATVTSYITNVWDDGEIEYADISTDGGGVERYQCMNCGWTIKDEFGEYIKEPDELYEWMKQTLGKGETTCP